MRKLRTFLRHYYLKLPAGRSRRKLRTVPKTLVPAGKSRRKLRVVC